MKLFKPNWVTHDDKPIFSIDIHPAGRRFATGGQGCDSGRVVVWNLNCVLEESAELDPNVPKMLCQMDNHLACVNSVRWSCGGRYLASGGDDKLVMVWALGGAGGSGIFGSNGKLNVETWRCVSTLRGHAGDVLDLAWSPTDKWLASCSVDNTVIVWNADKFPEMIYVLHGHTGLVKGVAWDPVGKYLASQSDDKSLRIWKTADWTEESVITDPFDECGGTTHVLRLSWSPDGQYVVSAHAMNGGGPTAQIVERDGWRTDKDFVGHRKAVTCVRFNSNILCPANGSNGKGGGGRQFYCCTAIGSRDRSLSVWFTSLKRPLVVINELFTDSVLDLSWSTDGLNLLACSWDGTVACIQFSNKEIGTPLTLQEKNALYERTYGKSLGSSENPDLYFANLLVESPEILKAREKPAVGELKKEPVKVETPENAHMSPSSGANVGTNSTLAVTPVRPIDRQIETRTSDGKRRITPVFIPLHQPMDTSDSVVLAMSAAQPDCFSISSQNKSRIVVERRDDIVIHPNVSNHAPSALTPSQVDAVAATFTGAVTPAVASMPAAVPPTTPVVASTGSVQTSAVVSNEINVDGRLKRRASATALPGPHADDVAKKMRPASPTQMTTVATPNTVTLVGDLLPVPTLGTVGPIVRYAGKYRVQVLNNACSTPQGKLTRLQLLPGNSASSEPLWESFLGSPASCVSFAGLWISVACVDSSLHVWRICRGPSLRRAAPPIMLSAKAHRMLLAVGTSSYLAVLTVRAYVYVWRLLDDVPPAALLPPLDAQHLIPADGSVSHFSLMDDGTPVIALTNGRGFIYCKDMHSWVISWDWRDGVWCLARSTNGVSGVVTRGPAAVPSAPLASVQAASQRTSAPVPMPTMPSSHSAAQGSYQAGAILSYLDWQLASAERFTSSLEYKHWLLAMAAHLTQHGPEQRLRQLLDDLMGPSHCTSKSNRWQSTVLGLSKHELLEKTLEMVGKQLRWQRIYSEYTYQMDMIKEVSQNGDLSSISTQNNT